MSRYEVFNQLINLTKLTNIKNGYAKMIQTGDLEFWDYKTGFLDVSIYYVYGHDHKHYVRLWFGTTDDGDFGGWKEMKTEKEARKLVKRVANEVFKDMITLPTKKILNEQLRRYGIYVCDE